MYNPGGLVISKPGASFNLHLFYDWTEYFKFCVEFQRRC